jgi:hypothetical protein
MPLCLKAERTAAGVSALIEIQSPGELAQAGFVGVPQEALEAGVALGANADLGVPLPVTCAPFDIEVNAATNPSATTATSATAIVFPAALDNFAA